MSPRTTVTSLRREPNCPALSQVEQSAQAPIWRRISAEESGMKGVSRTAHTRRVSSRWYMTLARRAPLASISLASTQGVFSSIYLFAREMTLKISARAFWKA